MRLNSSRQSTPDFVLVNGRCISALRGEMHTKFRTVLSEHLNGEFTLRPIVDFSFMHYPKDERPMLEKSMRHSRIKRAQDFLDVLLFLHAVPQREPGRWDALDHDSDVTWFRAHAEVYQSNEPLMAFLRDCAVVVLITGCFDISPDVKAIHDCYLQLK